MHPKTPTCLLVSALLMTALAAALSGRPTEEAQPLRATAEIVGQKYCSDSDGKTYSIEFKLNLHFVNQSNRKIIVQKSWGPRIYDGVIAADAVDFRAERYESNWFSDGDGFFISTDGKEV